MRAVGAATMVRWRGRTAASIAIALGAVLSACGHDECPAGGEGADGECTSGGDLARARAGTAGIVWVRLSAGSFDMGSTQGESDELPVHRVALAAFEIARTEVTVAQYKACVEAGVCSPAKGSKDNRYCNSGQKGREDHPINCVSWQQATRFSEWVGGRLPTEAEWEYAARSAGKPWRYPWGNTPAPDCQRVVMDDGQTRGGAGVGTAGCGEDRTWPVCSKRGGETRQGLCDMLGNVWEWTADGYGEYLSPAPIEGEGPSGGPERVFRGCSWYLKPRFCRAAGRDWYSPDVRWRGLGFRPARSLP